MWRIPGGDGEGPVRPAAETERACFMPASLDWRVVLIETPDVVCYLDDVRVYPSSCWFQVHSRLRPSAATPARDAFAAADPGMREPTGDAAELDGAFLLGIEYEDGRQSAVCLEPQWPQPFEDTSQDPILRFPGGSRTDGDADAEVALEGLPEKGSIKFHARWTALGAAESTVELDGAALREAASRAVELWPATGFSSPAQ